MAKKKNTKNKETLYGIIGLGRFGFALAQSLAEAGKEILVIDREQGKINAAAAFTDNAFWRRSASRTATLWSSPSASRSTRAF